MTEEIKIEDIDPDSHTIEVNIGKVSHCIIVEGKHKGVCFIKENGKPNRIIKHNTFDMQEIRKHFPHYNL